MLSNERPKISSPRGRSKVARAVALLIAVVAPVATAQNPLTNERGAHRSPGCLPRATRTRESCDPMQTVIRTEKEVEFLLELPPLKIVQCAVTIEVAYTHNAIPAWMWAAQSQTTCAERPMVITNWWSVLGTNAVKCRHSNSQNHGSARTTNP
jgi:hypothetical protein